MLHKSPKRTLQTGAILVLNSNDMTSLLANDLTTDSTVSGLHSVGKGIPHGITLNGWQKYSEKLLSQKVFYSSFARRLQKVHFVCY